MSRLVSMPLWVVLAFFMTAPVVWAQATAQRQQAAFSGAIAGGPVNYTMNVPTPLGWQNTRGFRVCGAWPQLNEGPATLSVERKSALPIMVQTVDGNFPLAGHELLGTQCLVVDDTETAFVFEGMSGGILVNPSPVPYSVSKSEWTFGRHFVFEADGELTLPDATTIGNQSGIVVQTLPGVTVTLIASSIQDGINGKVAGAPADILPDTTTIITSSGAHGIFAFRVPTGSGGGSGTVTDCTQASDFINRVHVVYPTLAARYAVAYRQLICGLVSDGIWAKFDGLWIMATETQAVANLNLISANYNLTPVGAPDWAVDQGYTGGGDMGTAKYIDTHLNPAASPTVAELGSLHIMAWSLTDLQSSGYASAMGAGANAYISLAPRTVASSQTQCAINSPSAGYYAAADVNSNAAYVCTRSSTAGGSTNVMLYRNVQQLNMMSIVAATALPTNNLYLLGQSAAGGTMVNGSGLTIAAASYGSSLDQTQVASESTLSSGSGLLPRVCHFLRTVRGSC